MLFVDDLNGMGLRVRVYGGDRLRRDRLVGEKFIPFSSLDLDEVDEQSQDRGQSIERLIELEPRSNIEVCPCVYVEMCRLFGGESSRVERLQCCKVSNVTWCMVKASARSDSQSTRHRCSTAGRSLQSCRLQSDLYCVKRDVKPFYDYEYDHIMYNHYDHVVHTL